MLCNESVRDCYRRISLGGCDSEISQPDPTVPTAGIGHSDLERHDSEIPQPDPTVSTAGIGHSDDLVRQQERRSWRRNRRRNQRRNYLVRSLLVGHCRDSLDLAGFSSTTTD
jgi:hypothetical protein